MPLVCRRQRGAGVQAWKKNSSTSTLGGSLSARWAMACADSEHPAEQRAEERRHETTFQAPTWHAASAGVSAVEIHRWMNWSATARPNIALAMWSPSPCKRQRQHDLLADALDDRGCGLILVPGIEPGRRRRVVRAVPARSGQGSDGHVEAASRSSSPAMLTPASALSSHPSVSARNGANPVAKIMAASTHCPRPHPPT